MAGLKVEDIAKILTQPTSLTLLYAVEDSTDQQFPMSAMFLSTTYSRPVLEQLIKDTLPGTMPFRNATDYGVTGDGVTDDTSNMQAAFDATSDRRLEVPPGTYRMTAGLTMNANMHLTGHGVTFDFSTITDETCLSVIGSTLTALPAQVGDYNTNNHSWQMTAHGLSKGDVVQVQDTADYSYSSYRTYYKKTERFIVREITDSNNFKTVQKARFAWASTDATWTKFPDATPIIEGDIRLKGGTSTDCDYVILMQNVVHPRLRDLKLDGGTRSACRIDNVYGGIIDGCYFSKEIDDAGAGLSYGLEFRNAQDCGLINSIFQGDRHGLSLGGNGLNINVSILNNKFYGQIQNSVDMHGNCEYCTISHCFCDFGLTVGGNHIKVNDNHIWPKTNYGLRLVEMKGADYEFHDNNIHMADGASPMTDAALMIYDGWESMTEDGTFVVNGLTVETADSTINHRLIWMQANSTSVGPTGRIRYKFSNVIGTHYQTQSTTYSIEIEHAAGAVPAEITIKDCDLPSGIIIQDVDGIEISNTIVRNGAAYGLRVDHRTSTALGRITVNKFTVDACGAAYYPISIQGSTTAGNIKSVYITNCESIQNTARGVTFTNVDKVRMRDVWLHEDSTHFRLYVAPTVNEIWVDGFYINDITKCEMQGVKHYINVTGSGNPSTLIASVGSMFRRIDGSSDGTLYIKESGDGSTGWITLIST